MSHEQVVLVTLVVYKLVLVGIGLATKGRTHDGLDFFLGGRQLGPTVAALSAAASSSSPAATSPVGHSARYSGLLMPPSKLASVTSAPLARLTSNGRITKGESLPP